MRVRPGCLLQSAGGEARWRKMRPEPAFSFLRFSFAYVSIVVYVYCVVIWL